MTQFEFAIGDTIHYMEGNKPQSKEVKGVAKLEGKIEVSTYSSVNQKEGKRTFYFTDSYTPVLEEDAYPSAQDLQESLFGVGQRIV